MFQAEKLASRGVVRRKESPREIAGIKENLGKVAREKAGEAGSGQIT